MEVPRDQTRSFLQALFGTAEDLFFYLWFLNRSDQKKFTEWFPTNSAGIEQAADNAVALNQNKCDVYVGVSLHKEKGGPRERAKAGTVDGIVGLYLDIDFGDHGHKKKELPPTIEDARSLLLDLPKPNPTIVVHSGHGLQPWWLFKEPWLFADADDRQRAAAISRGWNLLFIRAAVKKGWAADNVGDLARVLRVPGTSNHKSDPPVPVSITEWSV